MGDTVAVPDAPHSIVTGGSSGIGAAVVRVLLDRGESVTILDLQPPEEDVPYLLVDVTDRAAVRAAVEAAQQRSGIITGVVTSHGGRGQYVPALDFDLDRARRVIDIHYTGTLAVCLEVVRLLGGEPGSIVTVSSTNAYGGWQRHADYGPAKSAIRQLTQNLAVEWASLGVRVNCVAPGVTLTPAVQQMIDEMGYDAAAVEARTPLGRLALPEEIASPIVYLLRDATFVTGQCLAVDGGWTAVGK